MSQAYKIRVLGLHPNSLGYFKDVQTVSQYMLEVFSTPKLLVPERTVFD